MKIEFDSPEEYDALCNMLMSSLRYWKKRRQEARGQIVMSLDSRNRLCASHYTEDEIAHQLESVTQMIDIVKNMPHQEDAWNDEVGDWIPADVAGEFAIWRDPEVYEDEVIEEVIEEKVEEAKIEYAHPRPDMSADMIEWMNRPEYANARWNQGYKNDPDFHFGSEYESGIKYE